MLQMQISGLIKLFIDYINWNSVIEIMVGLRIGIIIYYSIWMELQLLICVVFFILCGMLCRNWISMKMKNFWVVKVSGKYSGRQLFSIFILWNIRYCGISRMVFGSNMVVISVVNQNFFYGILKCVKLYVMMVEEMIVNIIFGIIYLKVFSIQWLKWYLVLVFQLLINLFQVVWVGYSLRVVKILWFGLNEVENIYVSGQSISRLMNISMMQCIIWFIFFWCSVWVIL